MKKILTTMILLTLCVSLSACSGKKGSEEFQEYAKTLPAMLLEGTSMDINFLFDHPEEYGIEREVYTLDFTSLEDFKKYNSTIEEKLKELDDYDYEKLDDDQKIVYDLLNEQREDIGIDEESLYYMSTNYFDVNSGVQAQLPMSLWNYEFKNQKSLDSFLAILQDAPSVFKNYIELEKQRQEKGYGMSQTYMDDVIEAVHTINTADQTYILEATNEKIDALDFINDATKSTYKEKVKQAFQDSFLSAFGQAEKDLKDIKIVKQGEGELSSYENGKRYYEAKVSSSAGVDTMKEYEAYLDEVENKAISRLRDVMLLYPEVNQYLVDNEKFSDAVENPKYTDLNNANDLIHTLEKTIASGEDFPKIQPLDYRMNEVPESMKDTIMASAAYYISAYDDPSGKDEQMILNGSFKQSDFTTIAHESFPGHMYQHNYFKSKNPDILRNLLGSSTYIEGWATYIQDKTCDYTKDPGLCHLDSVNRQLSYLYILDLDKQIHYEGLDRQGAYNFMKDNFGIEDEEDLSDQYEQLLENPGVFCNYYIGYYKLLDLKEVAEKAWGEEYTDLKFNTMILDLGPLPMDLLEKYSNLAS